MIQRDQNDGSSLSRSDVRKKEANLENCIFFSEENNLQFLDLLSRFLLVPFLTRFFSFLSFNFFLFVQFSREPVLTRHDSDCGL